MKKFVAAMLSVMLLLTACSSGDKVSDYFPIEENTVYEYKGSIPALDYKVYDLYTQTGKVQRRYSSTSPYDYVVEISDDSVLLKNSEAYNVFFNSIIDSEGTISDVLLQGPIKKGTTWNVSEYSYKDSQTGETKNEFITATITDTNVDVEVPFGKFKAIEITRISANTKVVYYYVKGIGSVKEVHTIKNPETGLDSQYETNLQSVTKDTSLEVPITIYYPDENYNVMSEDVTGEFVTNGNSITMLENLLRTKVNDTGSLISANTKINSITVDQSTSDPIIKIDLSKEFVSEMNLGSGFEEAVIQSLVDTLCGYSRIGNAVLLTIDGKAYESGHILLEDGELLYPNWVKNAKEDAS